MKIKFLYTISLTLILLTSSCLKDKSSEGTDPISKIETLKDLEKRYISDGQEITIKSPEFTQTGENKPLSYEWYINESKEPVSREKNLSYRFDDNTRGIFPALLKVSNGDSFYIREFEIKVPYPYEAGLYILSSDNGKSIISYLSEEKNFVVNKVVDISKEINGEKIKSMYFTNGNQANQMYFTIEGSPKVYRFFANEMKPKNTILPNNPSINSTQSIHSSDFYSDVDMYLIQGNKFFTLNGRNSETSTMVASANFPNMKLFDKFLNFRDPIGYTNGTILFDNNDSKLLVYVKNSGIDFKEILENQFSGMKAISLNYSNSEQKDMIIILKNKTEDSYKLISFFPGVYNGPEVKERASIKISTDFRKNSISEETIFKTAHRKGFLYYSNRNNEVYSYVIASNGNFVPPILTYNTDEKVADIFIDKNEERLYIATNGTSSGNVYCYDISNNNVDLLWKKDNIKGKIQQLDYRYTSDIK